MDNYEHVEASAGVTVDHTDLGLSDEDVRTMTAAERAELRQKIRDTALDWLADNLEGEMEALSRYADRKSFIHPMLDDLEDVGPKDNDRGRTVRRRR